MTQQHLSQIENGQRRLSLEQRRRVVEELGVAPEELGLAAGPTRTLVARHGADPEVAASWIRWREQRRWLNRHRSELAKLAVRLYGDDRRIEQTSLIADPRWQLREPVELGALQLQLDESPQAVDVAGNEPESADVRPFRTATERFDRYTAAIKHLDPPSLFESRPSYRLLGADLSERRLEFGMAVYFDKLDISEALGHELAAACIELGGSTTPAAAQLAGRLPFRDLVGNPFDPRRRAIIPAITTLTIRLRRYPAEPAFLLHWRDPAKVATAAGIYDVIPAGEFQPSGVALRDRSNDFDLWRNIVRDYSEELLGAPEHDGTRTEPIDYASWSLDRELGRGRDAGTLGAFFLGLGLDALTLAATILTVVVIDDDLFGQVFGSMVRYNDEGEIVAVGEDCAAEGVPFTASTVQRMLQSEPMASPGEACLALAWKHRELILGL